MVVRKKKKRAASSSSGGFSMPSTASSAPSSTKPSGQGSTLSGSKFPTTRVQSTLKPSVAKELGAEPRRGGGGFRGTFFQANRPQAARARTARTRAPRTASGRTFDEAARARIAAAQAARGGAAATGDVFEILVKTYSADRRDALADAFIEVLVQEMPEGETGVLIDSAHVEDFGDNETTYTAQVVVDAPYAQYVNDGSDAVDGKLMVWEGDDGTVFATSRVAIPPNPFWDRALARWDEVVALVDSQR